jgi:hypothetical protein
MSTSAAIAAVTETLRALLATRVELVGNGTVVAEPPTRASSDALSNAVNLFLYHVTLDAAWRNIESYGAARPGETSQPPLALVLHYLLTAYAETDAVGQQLLGAAMSALHDRPLLDPALIRASAADIPEVGGLDQQVERVRITADPMGTEEMSRLWTMFATPYRLSIGYQACVVLIDSDRPVRAPAPVLYQGPGDRGPVAQAGTGWPVLLAVVPANASPAAYPGTTVTLRGTGLAGARSVTWQPERAGRPPVTVVPRVGPGGDLVCYVPADPAFAAGIYTVVVTATFAGTPTTTNAVPVAVAPAITSPLPVNPGAAATVQLGCRPPVLAEQDVFLVVGERPVRARPGGPADQPSFDRTGIPAGQFPLRLRVDRVDSSLIDYAKEPPEFDPTRAITVQR